MRKWQRVGLQGLAVAGLGAAMVFAGGPADSSKAEQPFSIRIEGEVSPELAPAVGQLVTTFYEVYPRLVERFGGEPHPAPRTVTVVFKKPLRVPAMAGGDRVTISADWLARQPDDLGMLTHELTHLVQAYPPGAPGWLVEGIAEVSRASYTPHDRPGWKLPDHFAEGQNFDSGYTVSGRFLKWLDEKFPGSLDRIHRKLQEGTYEADFVRELTGKSLEELWGACLAEVNGGAH